MMTRGEIEKDNRYYLHHKAYFRGYVSRKNDVDALPAAPYKGIYGKGFTVNVPCYTSTRYAVKEYWLEVTP